MREKNLKLVIGMPIDKNNQHQSLCLKGFDPRLHQTYQSGYTLVEILVVLLIISITVGFAVLAFGDFGKSRKIRSAAEGFGQFVSLVHERALLESSTLRIHLTPLQYSAERLDLKQHWQPLQSSFYRKHALPEKTKLLITYGNKTSDHLFIIISGSGDMTPFQVSFGSPDRAQLATVSGDANGAISFHDTDTR